MLQQNHAYNIFCVCIMNKKSFKETYSPADRDSFILQYKKQNHASHHYGRNSLERKKNAHLTLEEKTKLLIYPRLLYSVESCFGM